MHGISGYKGYSEISVSDSDEELWEIPSDDNEGPSTFVSPKAVIKAAAKGAASSAKYEIQATFEKCFPTISGLETCKERRTKKAIKIASIASSVVTFGAYPLAIAAVSGAIGAIQGGKESFYDEISARSSYSSLSD